MMYIFGYKGEFVYLCILIEKYVVYFYWNYFLNF